MKLRDRKFDHIFRMGGAVNLNFQHDYKIRYWKVAVSLQESVTNSVQKETRYRDAASDNYLNAMATHCI